MPYNCTGLLDRIAVVAVAAVALVAGANVTQLMLPPGAAGIYMAIGVHIAGQQILAIIHIVAARIAASATLLAQLIALGAGAVAQYIAAGLHLVLVQQYGHTASMLKHLIVATDIHTAITISGEALATAATSLVTVRVRRAALQENKIKKKYYYRFLNSLRVNCRFDFILQICKFLTCFFF